MDGTVVDSKARSAPEGRRSVARRIRGATLLVTAGVVLPWVHAAILARAGFGFILDDWFTLRNAHFDGAFAAAGHDQLLARPGAWLVYGIVFGLLGDSPLVILLSLAAIRSATVICLWSLLRNFVPNRTAAAVAACWAVLPVTSSLEFWASGTNIALALLGAVLGLRALRQALEHTRPPVLAAALLASSVLLYEAVAPAAALAVVLVGWHVHRNLRVVVRSCAAPTAAIALSSLWVLANWHPAKTPTHGFADFSPVLEAHFGWGVVGFTALAPISAAMVTAAVLWSLGTLVVPSLRHRAGSPEHMVAVGVLVVLVSLVPFALYAYEPLGVGDRVNVTSSVGAALVWIGVAKMVWNRRPQLAVGGVVLVGTLAIGMRATLLNSYAWAFDEASRVVDSLPCAVGNRSHVIAGPKPDVRYNVTTFIDAGDHLAPAAQLSLDRPAISVEVVLDEQELQRAGGADIDLDDPAQCDP